MIEQLTTEAIELLKKLISKQSFSGEENETALLIMQFLSHNGIAFESDKHNVWAKNKHFDASKKTILLNSHHDTVKPNKGYTRNPLKAEVIDGKLYGLGSNDAGGCLVSLLATFTYFFNRKNLKYNFVIVASAEEENSGPNGLNSMLNIIPEIDFAIVGEPTLMNLAIAEKGLVVMNCEAKGTAGHAAHGIGDNAIYNAMKDMNWFQSFEFPKVSETLGKVKKTASSLDGNDSAKIYRFNDYNIVEFTTKANALDYDSMDALKKATDKPLIIINEGMQFSAGVNLNYLMDFVKQKDFKSIEKFLKYFQETCKHLKYCENPVISAPSGLTLGGGFEILVQSDYVIAHTNIVLGLVETLVGLIPCGGGCKEMLWRWMQTEEAKKDSDFTPQKVFDIIGYGKTITSPMEAMSFKFLLTKDKSVMNRNELLPISRNLITKIKNEYEPPKSPIFNLSGIQVRDKMFKTLENLFREKKILEHGMEVGKKLAFVLSGGNTNIDKKLSEDDLYALEFEAFIQLLQMEKTQARINHTLKTGKPLIN